MAHKLRLAPIEATLLACAAFGLAGESDDVDRFCRELGRVLAWSPVKARLWLARVWGEGWVSNGSATEITDAGWVEVHRRFGDVDEDVLDAFERMAKRRAA